MKPKNSTHHLTHKDMRGYIKKFSISLRYLLDTLGDTDAIFTAKDLLALVNAQHEWLDDLRAKDINPGMIGGGGFEYLPWNLILNVSQKKSVELMTAICERGITVSTVKEILKDTMDFDGEPTEAQTVLFDTARQEADQGQRKRQTLQ